MVMVELDPAVIVEGEKETSAPLSAPLALNPTDWATPEVTTVLMVLVAAEPAEALAEAGEAEIEKSFDGGEMTSSVKAVE